MMLFKSLNEGGRSIHCFRDIEGRVSYVPPQLHGKPGAWKPSCLAQAGNLVLKPHFWGYHLAYADTIADWFHRENYVAEAKGRMVNGETCVVAEQIRLTRLLPLGNADWITLALGFAEQTVPLFDLMHFPKDHGKVVGQSFAAAKAFLAGETPDMRAALAWKSCVSLIGRNEIDSHASHDWMYNSQAAQHAALAVASLGLLRRLGDGQRLYDFCQQETPIDKYLADTSEGMGLLFARGERLLDKDADNFRVAKDVSGYGAKAANLSVLQAQRMAMPLAALQQSWIAAANPRLNHRDQPADQALSGIRQLQSRAILTQAGLDAALLLRHDRAQPRPQPRYANSR